MNKKPTPGPEQAGKTLLGCGVALHNVRLVPLCRALDGSPVPPLASLECPWVAKFLEEELQIVLRLLRAWGFGFRVQGLGFRV